MFKFCNILQYWQGIKYRFSSFFSTHEHLAYILNYDYMNYNVQFKTHWCLSERLNRAIQVLTFSKHKIVIIEIEEKKNGRAKHNQ